MALLTTTSGTSCWRPSGTGRSETPGVGASLSGSVCDGPADSSNKVHVDKGDRLHSSAPGSGCSRAAGHGHPAPARAPGSHLHRGPTRHMSSPGPLNLGRGWGPHSSVGMTCAYERHPESNSERLRLSSPPTTISHTHTHRRVRGGSMSIGLGCGLERVCPPGPVQAEAPFGTHGGW